VDNNTHPRHAGDLYSSENPVREFAEAVFVRPSMYTIGGTLEEVAAFLEGFYSGMIAHNRDRAAFNEAARWRDFCAWAAEQIGGAERPSWVHMFQALRRAYPDDTAGFLRLAELYIAFRRERDMATETSDSEEPSSAS
jgi:hypothetical protein